MTRSFVVFLARSLNKMLSQIVGVQHHDAHVTSLLWNKLKNFVEKIVFYLSSNFMAVCA